MLPWADLALGCGASCAKNAQVDLTTTRDGLAAAARIEEGVSDLLDPLVSPKEVDPSGLPPNLAQVESLDVLRGETM